MRFILHIFKQHIWRVLLVYGICNIAYIFWFAEPYVLGKMIDGIIAGEYWWTYAFIGINILFIAFGYIRRVIDTKIFSKMYNNFILDYIRRNICSLETSTVVARVDMSRTFTDFLENVIPSYFATIYALVGSIIAIYLISHGSAYVMLTICVPASFIVWWFYHKSSKMQRVNNSNSENNVAVIERRHLPEIEKYYGRKRKILIMSSTLDATSSMSFESMSLVFVIATMIYYISTAGCTAGMALTFYGYINRFTGSLGSVNYVIFTIAQIRDVTNRLKANVPEWKRKEKPGLDDLLRE